MKLLILTAIVAAVASSPVTQGPTWPWQVGKVYRYDASSYTSATFEEGERNGNAIKTEFIVSVKAAGHLQAKLENSLYKSEKSSDKDAEFQPIPNMDQTFDIFVDGGRVVSINFPSSLSVVHENLIKGFISALQVDVSTFGQVHDYPNSYDKEAFQGLFKKMETDLTGECETLYVVSPTSAEWRQELPAFTSEEAPIEIVKTKNYGACSKRLSYDFGVPEGAVWKGLAKGNEEKQFIKHNSNNRVLVGKQGTIYKSEILSSVFASPLVYGKQKAEVNTVVTVNLKSVEQDNTAEWQKCKDCRSVDSVVFTLDNSWRLFTYGGEKNVAMAQKILQEIAPMLQDPGHLEKGDFLMKFNVLVYLFFTMNAQQLAQMTSSIEIAKTSKNVAKNGMWVVYRDAVAQSGTPRAFDEIKSWVLTNKINGEEAAQVVTAIGTTLAPSKAVLTDFFNFATCPEVLGQKALNNSALLAVSKLLRFSKEEQFIVETVIPHFSKELKRAIDNGESSKAQVYVRVLGNLAHPGILKAFAPYLEGQVTVTKYLRTQMVASLKTLANLKDEYVRSVLYSILKNTAESYEIRVAAALNIFLAFPTDEMMQVMAYMTSGDPSTQVRAVLATSITFAAGLKEPRFAELAKTAQSVMHIITKEKFGYSYSTDSLIDGYTSDEEFSFFRELSFTGSDNTLLPKYHRSALRFKGTAFGDERQVTLSVSDVVDIINNLASTIYDKSSKGTEPTFKFSAKQIIEMLNIKFAAREPIEGALFVENLNQQKLITFNEEELFALIKNIFDGMADITSGVKVHFTKILRHNLVNVDFPLASGMPFTYQYSEPMIINAQLETKLKFDEKTKGGLLESKFDVTYARNIVGTVGFMDTIGEVLVGAGVINKLQVRLPATIKTTFKMDGDFTVQIEPPQTDNDIKLVHLSVIPYTGTQKRDTITYNLKPIERSLKDLVSPDFKFGEYTGMHYSFEGNSFSSDYKNYKKLFNADLLTNLGHLMYQKDIALTEFNLKYLSKDSTTKSVTLALYYDKLYNQKNSGEMGPATLTEHVEPNSVPRRAEVAKKASTGIEAAEVTLLDVSAVFNGPKKIEYVFTGAYANSFVDPKVQAAFIARGNEQISVVFQLNKEGAKIVPLNFKSALDNEIKLTFNSDLKFGNNMSMHMQGYGERTDLYTESLKNDFTGKSCLADVSNNNLYQKDCHEMIIKAHTPDYFKATVTYDGGDEKFWHMLDAVYKYLKDVYELEEEINPFVKTEGNKVEIERQAFYSDSYSNYNFKTTYGLLSFNNVEGLFYEPYALSIYALITAWERTRNCFTGYQYMPYCAIDDSKVRTFSGRSYNYKLTSSWHVVMVDSSDSDELVILTRRPNENEEEVYVSYKTENGKYVELEIKPKNVEVKTNSVKTCEGALTMYFDDSSDVEAPLLEYYNLAKNIQVFSFRNGNLRLVYDYQRLVIFTDEHRSTTRGLCGESTGQSLDDFMTPFGLVSLPEHYGAAFSLEGEFSDPKTAELKKEAKQKAYQPVTKFTKVLKPDADWSKVINKTIKSVVV